MKWADPHIIPFLLNCVTTVHNTFFSSYTRFSWEGCQWNDRLPPLIVSLRPATPCRMSNLTRGFLLLQVHLFFATAPSPPPPRLFPSLGCTSSELSDFHLTWMALALQQPARATARASASEGVNPAIRHCASRCAASHAAAAPMGSSHSDDPLI